MQTTAYSDQELIAPLFLVIESNLEDANILEIQLRDAYQQNHAAVIVHSIQEASDALIDFEFDALIFGSSSEDIDPLNAVQAFNELKPSLPIVVVTNNADFSLANPFIASGAQDYLHKHELTAESLLRSLAFAIQRKAALKTSVELQAQKSEIQSGHNPLQLDPLTDIPNLSYFYNFATTAMFRAQRANATLALIQFDLNDFALINQQYGRFVGDELLKQVAERCQTMVRHTECIARLYDDNFVVITDTLTHPHEAYPLINRLLECFDTPFEAGKKQIIASPSLGVAYLPQPSDLNEWIKLSDAAKLAAKKNSKQRVEFAEQDDAIGYRRIQSIAEKVEKGLSGQEFSTVFQSLYASDESETLYAEALSRWRSTTLGNVAPKEFIPAISQNSMHDELTKQVLAQVASLQAQATNANKPIGRVSINITTNQLHDRTFCENFLHWLSVNDLDPNSICLEVSERESIDNILSCKSNIHYLHKQGVNFALDNFGTGNTSLTQLAELPIDYLKIDRAIIQNIDRNKPMQALSASLINMAHKLGMKVVAEGVETQEEFYVLRAFDCDFYQGYYFGQPCNSQTLMQNHQSKGMQAIAH